jgi:putative transcriptional regulator
MLTNRLAEWRQRQRHGKGVSRAQLARKVDVSRSYITRIEQGKRQPSVRVMFRIAKYFGCKLEDVFEYVPDEEKGS